SRVAVEGGDDVVVAEALQCSAGVDKGVPSRTVGANAPAATGKQLLDGTGGSLIGLALRWCGAPTAERVVHLTHRFPCVEVGRVQHGQWLFGRTDRKSADVDQCSDQA